MYFSKPEPVFRTLLLCHFATFFCFSFVPVFRTFFLFPIIPELKTLDSRLRGNNEFCSIPIYQRLCVMPHDTLRLSAQSLMNQAATSQLSAVGRQQSVKQEKIAAPPVAGRNDGD